MDFKIVQYTGTGEQVVGSGSIEGDKLQFETADFELDIELRRIIRQGYVHRLVQGESPGSEEVVDGLQEDKIEATPEFLLTLSEYLMLWRFIAV